MILLTFSLRVCESECCRLGGWGEASNKKGARKHVFDEVSLDNSGSREIKLVKATMEYKLAQVKGPEWGWI